MEVELGDRQGNGAGSGLPGPLAIAVAVVGTLCVTLAVAGAVRWSYFVGQFGSEVKVYSCS